MRTKAQAESALAPYQKYISIYSQKYGVPENFIRAVIMQESSGNPNAYRAEPQINDGSRGLMQILLKTARGLGYEGPEENLFNPSLNIELGTKLLKEIMNRCKTNDFRDIYSAYNSGGCKKWENSLLVAEHVVMAMEWLSVIG